MQVSSCSPQGNECYYNYISENKENLTSTCLKPCYGVYGDIQHITQDNTVTISKNGEPTETIFKEYLDYKRGFEADYLSYFSNITASRGSAFLNKFVTREVASCNDHLSSNCLPKIGLGIESCGGTNKCKYEIQEKLQVVEIYLDTPTFDKITRDAKTNSIAKLSLIGGTLGLLTCLLYTSDAADE